MTTVNSIDISVAVNLLMCVGIVLVSVWGYYRIRKITPLYFGCAYTLFAISHFLLLNGGENPPGPEFFVLRTTGYAFVVIGLFAILRDIIRKTEAEADLARLTGGWRNASLSGRQNLRRQTMRSSPKSASVPSPKSASGSPCTKRMCLSKRSTTG